VLIIGRRTRRRWVKQTPNNFYFSETPPSDTNEILTVSEFEAMRLKHYVNLNQKDAAEKMGVSQPTFSRILDLAHEKITRALIMGTNIRVSGGNYDVKKTFIGYGCLNCDREWEDESASKQKKDIKCPDCSSEKVYYLVKEPL